MKSRFFLIVRCLTIAIICSIILSGCAGFSGSTLPQYTYNQLKPPQKKHSIDYDAKDVAVASLGSLFDSEGMLQEEINKVFAESHFFSTYNTGTVGGEYHFSFVFSKDEEAIPFAFRLVDNLLFAFSAGFVPMYDKFDLTLSVDVKKDDQVIKQYVYKDHVNSWVETLLIIMAPIYYPKKAVRETMDKMLLVFLHDLKEDNLLEMRQFKQNRNSKPKTTKHR
jgi:hypothetical protein